VSAYIRVEIKRKKDESQEGENDDAREDVG
jgi:hypothetical protein